MAVMLRAHVIVMVTTGTFSGSVASFAAELMTNGQLQVILVDGEMLDEYKTGGRTVLQRHFHAHAQDVLRLKQTQLVGGAESGSAYRQYRDMESEART